MEDPELVFSMLTSAEQISLGLGILSVVLGTIAIIQAFYYKKEQDRQAKVQDVFLREQRINTAFSCIRNRDIHRLTLNRGDVILRKDRAVIFATSTFDPDIIDQNMGQIEDYLSQVLKDNYSSKVISAIRMHDIRLGDNIAEVTLRRECGLEDLNMIIEVNKKLDKYGLYISLLIE